MTDLRTAAQQALEALDLLDEYDITRAMLTDEAIEQVWATADAATDALRAALAQQDEPKGGDGMTSQTAYVVMLNDSPEHVVIGDKDLAQMRMHELRERYWVRHQGTLESRKKYALRCHWYIREVDGEVAA